MSRTIAVHPMSLAAGLGLGATFALLLGASQALPQILHLPRVRVDGIPAPDQMVRLVAADLPYTVPAHNTLVITGVGQVQPSHFYDFAEATISIGGQVAIDASTRQPDAGGTSGGGFVAITPGITATSGAIVSASTPPTGANAPFVILGYLNPQ